LTRFLTIINLSNPLFVPLENNFCSIIHGLINGVHIITVRF